MFWLPVGWAFDGLSACPGNSAFNTPVQAKRNWRYKLRQVGGGKLPPTAADTAAAASPAIAFAQHTYAAACTGSATTFAAGEVAFRVRRRAPASPFAGFTGTGLSA